MRLVSHSRGESKEEPENQKLNGTDGSPITNKKNYDFIIIKTSLGLIA